LSQSKFAENVGISIGNLSGLENHKYEPSYRAIIKILEVFKVDPIWLLIGEGEMTRQGTEGDASIYKVGDPLDEDPEIAELLNMTGTVLKAGTDHTDTLITNIRSLYRNLLKNRDLNDLKSRVAALEKVAHPPSKPSQIIRKQDDKSQRGEILKKRQA